MMTVRGMYAGTTYFLTWEPGDGTLPASYRTDNPELDRALARLTGVGQTPTGPWHTFDPLDPDPLALYLALLNLTAVETVEGDVPEVPPLDPLPPGAIA